jgi:uncharacterized membrane protein YeaQ/YmgE (transglycosylase-associated protein family)
VTAPFVGLTVEVEWEMAWLMVGLVFGCLAGSLIGRGGNGRFGDGVVLVGALAGGLLLECFSDDTTGLKGGLIVALLSACIPIGLQRIACVRKAGPTRSPSHQDATPVHGGTVLNTALCTASDDVPLGRL